MKRIVFRRKCLVLSSALMSVVASMGIVPRAVGQTSAQQQGARAQQIQLSDREQGNVIAQQNAAQGAGGGVNTVQPVVNITGRYMGSVTDSAEPVTSHGELSLSFEGAIQRGLRFNLGTVTADNSQRLTRSQRLAALSQILPSVTGTLSETVSQSYLPSIGITSALLGGMVKIPDVTGQYHFYTLQGAVSEDALDLTALYNLRSATASGAAAQRSVENARELIILAVGSSYVQAIATAALVDAQRDQVKQAEASYKQAEDQRTAGIRPAIDANRSLVELKTERLRLSSDDADLAKQKIRLDRLIGLSPATVLLLTTKLSPIAAPIEPVDDMLARAGQQRADLKAAELLMHAAAIAQKAARAEHLPSVSISGNYGLQGTDANKGRVAYQGVASLNIPIWQGGRVAADTAQADAVFSQRRAEYDDQRAEIEAQVRSAYLDLTVASEQVKVAQESTVLARETSRQSADRFAAGAADSVEVVQSQESQSSAEHDYISSLYAQTLARLHLAQASGNAASTFPTLLEKGSN